MANFKKHAKTGAFIGALGGGIYSIIKQINSMNQGSQEEFSFNQLVGSVIGGATLGTVGGVLPDLIEPATNPHHRGLMHSVSTGTAISVSNIHVIKEDYRNEVKFGTCTFSAGYLSHLILDSQTPYGLPII